MLFSGSWDIFPFNPEFAGRTHFLFPDRHDLFQAINSVTPRLEYPSIAMGGRAGDKHGRRLRIEFSNPLHDRDSLDFRPLAADLLRNLPHFLLCHRNVRLVFQIYSLMWIVAGSDTPDHAGEDCSGSGAG